MTVVCAVGSFFPDFSEPYSFDFPIISLTLIITMAVKLVSPTINDLAIVCNVYHSVSYPLCFAHENGIDD
jgi:hypothetical protein